MNDVIAQRLPELNMQARHSRIVTLIWPSHIRRPRAEDLPALHDLLDAAGFEMVGEPHDHRDKWFAILRRKA